MYTDFAFFGLYLFKEKGIILVINELLNQEYLTLSKKGILYLTEKGKFFYKHLYSKEILNDLKDPFDFFFEQQLGFDSIKLRKLEILEKYQSNQN